MARETGGMLRCGFWWLESQRRRCRVQTSKLTIALVSEYTSAALSSRAAVSDGADTA